MSEKVKIIRVTFTLVREYEPNEEHDFLFEEMNDQEIRKECLRLAREDLANASVESFYEEIVETEESY